MEPSGDWPDPPATGLAKFNLGTIPASVTPPRSWRRAAWFAVGTAAFVVCALGFAGVALVGNPRKSTTVDALPQEPSQRLAITDVTTTTIAATTTPGPGPAAPTSAVPVSTTTTTRRALGHPARSGPAQLPLPLPQPVPPQHPTTTTPRVAVSPTAGRGTQTVAVPLLAPQQVPVSEVTARYFALVLRDPRAALELTAGRLRAEGLDGIRARYAGVARLEIKKVQVDGPGSCSRSRLVMVYRDGSRRNAVRELEFTAGPEPRITADKASG